SARAAAGARGAGARPRPDLEEAGARSASQNMEEGDRVLGREHDLLQLVRLIGIRLDVAHAAERELAGQGLDLDRFAVEQREVVEREDRQLDAEGNHPHAYVLQPGDRDQTVVLGAHDRRRADPVPEGRLGEDESKLLGTGEERGLTVEACRDGSGEGLFVIESGPKKRLPGVLGHLWEPGNERVLEYGDGGRRSLQLSHAVLARDQALPAQRSAGD